MNDNHPRWSRWLSLVATLLLCGSATATNLTLTSPVGYQIATDKQHVRLAATEVANNEFDGYSGTLRLELWGFTSAFDGSQSGYKLASYRFADQLPGGYSFTNVNTGYINFTSPPPGSWYLSLHIREYVGANVDGYTTRDYRNFSVPVRVAGGAYVGDVKVYGDNGWVSYLDNTARLYIQQIRNVCYLGGTGTLRVDLWATSTPFTGGTLTGYRFFSDTLDPLLGGESYTNYDKTLAMYTTPPDGLYYVTLTISEYDTGEFRIIDYINYSGLKSFGEVAPVITSQPQSQRVKAGSNVSFSVGAAGTKPLEYQWRVNGQNISGATTSTLSLSGVPADWSGRKYTAFVKNAYGSQTSSEATLTVYTCSYALSANSLSMAYTGGAGNVAITTTSDCPWSVVNTNGWITISSATTGSGNATVSFNVAANNTAQPRTGTIVIGGRPFVIAQGAQYAPANLRGKTLIMFVGSGSGVFATFGKYLITTSHGITNTLQVVPVTGPTAPSAASYTFSRANATRAFCVFNGITATLDFASPIQGNFALTKADGSQQYGSFILINKTADLNGDGRPDIAWQNATNRVLSSWMMSGTNWLQTAVLQGGQAPPIGWNAVGTADFNNDGRSDILFQTSTGGLTLWLMNRTNAIAPKTLRDGISFGSGWKALATADFNNDRQPDVLFQHEDGRVALWLFNTTNYVSTIYLHNSQSAGTGWRVVACADFNRDQQTDILFQHTSGLVAAWLMNGTSYVDTVGFNGVPTMTSSWRVAGAGDMNIDGSNDILWQSSDWKLSAWLMNSRAYTKTESLRYGQLFSAGLKCIAPR